MSYVYMKVLESSPDRYERGMRLLTLGRLQRVYGAIAARLEPGDRVLDVGCGTGVLAAQLARLGCQVTAIDSSPSMLAQAVQRIRREGLAGQVLLKEMGAVDLDTAFHDGSFDAVVSSLVFSELSDGEIEYLLAECRRVLRTGGQLLVADEVMPDSALGKVATFLVRLPFAVLAFVLTQNTTRRVAGLRERILKAGFRVLEVEHYLAGTLRLFVADKV
jgi:ubiquinone/menaquinone biosynthesis C-methylase UbiE